MKICVFGLFGTKIWYINMFLFILCASNCIFKNFKSNFGMERYNLQDKGKSWKHDGMAQFFQNLKPKFASWACVISSSGLLCVFQRLVYCTFGAKLLHLNSDVLFLRYLRINVEAWREYDSSPLHQTCVLG